MSGADDASGVAPLREPFVVRATEGREYWSSERCYIDEWCNEPRDAAVSIAHARVLPGVTTRWHRLHGIVERYVVLAGAGIVEVEELPATKVGVGDVVVIPAAAAQRITCTSESPLAFLAVCSPRFAQTAYEELPDTPPPDASSGPAAVAAGPLGTACPIG